MSEDIGTGMDAGASSAPEPTAPSVGDQAPRGDAGDSERGSAPKREPRDTDAKASKPDAKPADAPRYRVKRNGQESEYDGETLARMLSDDWEDEIVGPGGKPHKLRRDAQSRLIQQGLGFDAKMRALAEREQRFQQEIELAQKDPKARLAFMASRLGIQDPDAWALERATELQQVRDQFAALMREGRGAEAMDLVRGLEGERAERERMLDQMREQKRRDDEQHAQALDRHKGALRAALAKVGVEWSEDAFNAAEQEHAQWARIDVPRTYGEVATAVAKAMRDKQIAAIRALIKRDGVRGLPDDLRQHLRELELEAAKAGKAEARQQQKPKEEPAAKEARKPMTAAEFLRASR